MISTFKVEISTIIIDEKMRGIGVETRFLNYAENWTKNCGFKDVFIHTNFINEGSIDFYVKHGYHNHKDLKMFYKMLDKNQI